MKRLLLILTFLYACNSMAQTNADSVSSFSRIIRLHLPTHLCAGAHKRVSFGYTDTCQVVMANGRATLGHVERTFLPDGIACPPWGCSYRSHVTFTDFPDTTVITSANDIRYVRINMEHSWLGDIYISITCPNNQQADILRYGGTGTSPCLDSISQEHRGWDSSTAHAPHYTFLGNPIDSTDSQSPCDSTTLYNQPGTGWNYCWSNNTQSGFTYAAGDGLIYRPGNVINSSFWRSHIDSSDVSVGTQFYHPDENFSNLIGCPLNGTWQIVVMDGWSADNGWIFDWEISLDPRLLSSDSCHITSCVMEGPYATQIDSVTFLLNMPESIATDTTLLYTFTITNNCGDTHDTTFIIHLHPNYTVADTNESCDIYSLFDTPILSTVDTVFHLLSQYGCDSIDNMHIAIHHSSFETTDTTLCENALPFLFENETFAMGSGGLVRSAPPTADTSATYQYTDSHGCDSTIQLNLTVFLSDTTYLDSTVCDNILPILWNGLTLDIDQSSPTDSGYNQLNTSLLLNNQWGCDSTVFLTLTIPFVQQTDIYDTVVVAQLPWSRFDTLFFNETDITILYPNGATNHCDSIVHYHLHIYDTINDTLLYYACESDLPVSYNDTLFTQEGQGSFLYTGCHGEDSIVTFILHVIPTTDTTICDSITEDQLPWFALDTLFNDTVADYIYHLFNEAGCDSIIHYNLYIFWNGDHCDTSLSYPNVITPNGDGVNDRFVIGGLIEHNCFRYNELTIYDRYGHCVYHKRNIATDTDWWNPAAQRAPSGTYFYYFKAHGVNIWTQHRGVIEVLRDK